MRKTHFSTMAVAAVLATSCNDNVDMMIQNHRVEAQISASVLGRTRVLDTIWEANDMIGVFVKSPSSEGVFRNANVPYYTPDASGGFLAVSEKIYFPQDDEAVDFMAYYPYSSDNVSEGKYSFDLAANIPLSEKDLMYATVEGHSQQDGTVPFQFSHMLSKIEVQLKSDSKVLSGAAISINNQCDLGVFDVFDGSVAASSLATFDNELFFEERESAGQYHVIVMPTDQTLGRDIIIVVDGKTYTTPLDPTYTYDSGHKYSFTITMKGIDKDPENVEIVITLDINDWIDGPEVSLEGSENIPDVTGKKENILISSAEVLSDTPLLVAADQLEGLSIGDVICLYYQKDLDTEATVNINMPTTTRSINSRNYTLTTGTTAGRIGVAIDDAETLAFFAAGMSITGADVTLTCLSIYSNTLGVNTSEDGEQTDSTDATTDPLTANTIMLIDFEPGDDHGASWDKSWTLDTATVPEEEDGNTYMRLVESIADGWIFNCNHQTIQTVHGIENYMVKFDVRIDAGVTGASAAGGQYVIADKWLWVGVGFLPETTNGKWITVSHRISELNADLIGDLNFVDEENAVRGNGISATNVPAGISFDNLRLEPIE